MTKFLQNSALFHRWKVAFALILTGALVTVGYFGWRLSSMRSTVLAFVPPRPTAVTGKPRLLSRIADAENAAHQWLNPVAGLEALSRLYHANGCLAEASRAYEGLCVLQPDEPRWPHLRCDILAGFGRLDEALPLEKRAVALAPGYVPARIRLAEILVKSGQSAAAAGEYSSILKTEPDQPFALLGLARVATSEGRWPDARELLEKATNAHHDFAAAWALLASVREHLGESSPDDAARYLGLNSGANPMLDPWKDELWDDCFDVYRLDVAAVQIAGSDLPRAIALLRRASTLDERDAATQRHLGTMLERAGEKSEARVCFERATTLGPDAEANWTALIGFLERADDKPALDQTLAAAFGHCSDSPRVLLAVGTRLIERERFTEASAALRRALRLDANQVEACVALGRLEMIQGHFAEGHEMMQRALTLAPEHPVALVGAARAEIALGDEGKARQWCGRVAQAATVSTDDKRGVVEQFRARFGVTP